MNNESATQNPSPAAVKPLVPERTRMLLQAPIIPALLRLSAPNVLNLLAITGLVTFDGLFIGRLGPDALAGISLVFPWVMLMQHGAASGMGGAVSSAIARALGAGDTRKANDLVTHAFWLALMLSTLFCMTMQLAGPLIYRLMGGRGVVLEYAVSYSQIAFGGVVCIWMLNLMGNVHRGTGNMKLPAVVIVASVLGHILISPLLIFGLGPFPGLGIAGAAWGLVLSFGVGSLVLLWTLRREHAMVHLWFRGVRFQQTLFLEFFRVGVPGMVNVAITNLTVVALTAVAAHLGRDAAIAYAIGARLEYIIIPLGFGIGSGILAMVGTNWSAKQYERARAIAWTGAAVVGLFCGAVGGFFALFPSLWMSIFTTQNEIAKMGASYLQIVGPTYALYGFGIGLYFACQGLGSVTWVVVANGVRLLVAAGGGWIAVNWLGLGSTGLLIAIALGFVAYAAFTALALSHTNPKK
jgi:putative MATE family efflux protein